MLSTVKQKIQIKGFPIIKIKSRDIIEKIRGGSFFMSSLKVYRKMYSKSKDNVVGDPNEGKLIIHDGYFCIKELGIKEVVKNKSISTANENDFVFCMFGINPSRHQSFVFSEDQKKQLIGFDDTALLIKDSDEFCTRVEKAATKRGFEIKRGSVEYYDPSVNNIGLFSDLIRGMQNIVFHKTKNYSYQQEYRFTIPNNSKADSLELDIGNISDISEIFTTEEIFNSFLNKR